MKNKNQILLSLAFLAIFFSTYSCIERTPEEERTPGLELAEINEAIAELVSKGYDVDTTAQGAYYVIREAGTGTYFPQGGDTCIIEYTGYFLNGSVFDASSSYSEDGLVEFIFSDDDYIPGFVDGLSVLNEGTMIELIIPSSLAYGAAGTYGIPPYTPLVFVIKMDEIKPLITED